ncbi:MAG: CHAT domain-containing tetratricopeptide repeat protein [Bacteroidota bacterium]
MTTFNLSILMEPSSLIRITTRIVIISVTGTVFGQSFDHPVDTTQAYYNFILADSLMTYADYESALKLFDSAREVYQQGGFLEKRNECTNKMSKIHWLTRSFELAESLAKEVVQFYTMNKHSSQYTEALNNLGVINNLTGRLDSALFYHQKVASIQAGKFGKNHISYADACNNIGVDYWEKGNLLSALSYYEKAFHIIIEKYGRHSIDAADMYHNMGLIYNDMGSYNRAIDMLLEAKRIWADSLGADHPDIALSYAALMNAHDMIGNNKKAYEYAIKSYEIDKKTFGNNHLNTGIAFNHIGIFSASLGQLDSALTYCYKAEDIIKNNVGSKSIYLVEVYLGLTQILLRLNQQSDAFLYAEKCQAIIELHYGDRHPNLVRLFTNIGELTREAAPKVSIDYYKKALKANLISKNELRSLDSLELNDILNSDIFIRSLSGLIATLTFHKRFEEAYHYSLVLDRLLDKVKVFKLRYQDKVSYARILKRFYKNSTEACYGLYQVTKNRDYLTSAYFFNERAKASALNANISDLSAKKFSGIPHSIIEKERSLKSDISYYRSMAHQLKLEENTDTLALLHYEEKLFTFKKELDSLIESVEKGYPKYFELKYNSKTISPQLVKEKLTNKQAVLEFFESDTVIYAFLITKQQFDTFILLHDSSVASSIQAITPILSSVQNDITNRLTLFKKHSSKLYSELLAEPLAELHDDIDQLILIPSTGLSKIPWDLLLKNQQGDDFRTLNYLFKDFSISYGYSASLLFRKREERYRPKEKLLAIAPVYQENDAYTGLREVFRNEMVPLKWNQPEAKAINRFFKGDILYGSEATERNFKQQAQDYQMLHLAMHAFVDHEESMQSKLVFTQDNDSIEDGMLHTFELFNMEIPAELVVLSACNTALGEIQEGEGVMSLARAFAYAGVPSLVMSHWNANDRTTAQLMTSFYQYLSEGERKDVALQKAKLDFLEIANDVETNPFYWGSFVVVGDTSPIDKKKHLLLWVFAIISMAAILGLLLKKRIILLNKS